MTEKDEGKLISDVEAIAGTLNEVRGDVKGILKVQAATEERLSQGVGHFKRIDMKIEEHEKAILKMPRGGVVYAIIGIGFTALGLIVAFVK